jgi:hypothetical protein
LAMFVEAFFFFFKVVPLVTGKGFSGGLSISLHN